MIEAYIFDVFGTLVDWRTGVARALGEAFVHRPDAGADPIAAAVFWRGQYQPSMKGIRSGGRGYVPLDVLHRENLDLTLEHFKIGAYFDGSARDELNRAWERLPPWPDTCRSLAKLKTHAIVAPCSNGSIALMTKLARFGGLSWDCILGADIARNYKPDEAVYLACCAALQLPPGQVMMVAAHNDDLAAARRAGLKTGFFPRLEEYGEGQTTDLEAEDDWDVAAADFPDFVRQIAG